jgi:hypothetical protein
MAEEKTKKWYKSKTFWFNTISVGLVLVDQFLELNILSIEVHGIIMGIGNIILRLFATDSATTT